ncbi:MAG: hypothetical protein P8010_13170 [Desulfosarcinaceae bacterium]
MDAFTPTRARGEWIILNSGEKFQTDRSWREEGRLKFSLNGLVVSVPETDVARVMGPQEMPGPPKAQDRPSLLKGRMTATAVDTSQSQRKQRLQNALRLPPPDPMPQGQVGLPDTAIRQPPSRKTTDNAHAGTTTAQAVSTAPETARPHSRHVFRDLAWGMRPSSMPGLVFSQTNPAYGGVDEFFDPDEELKLGTAPLNGIVYGFWQSRLYSITIWTDGRPSYEKLRQWVIDTYGPGHQRNKEVERRIWYGDDSDRLLEFDEALNTGIFWSRSHQLHTRIKQLQQQ